MFQVMKIFRQPKDWGYEAAFGIFKPWKIVSMDRSTLVHGGIKGGIAEEKSVKPKMRRKG